MRCVAVSASGDPMKGQPLQVVVAKGDHTFELDEEQLEQILLRPDIKDKKVVLISVAGAFRKGKSFLLNFFLRFLSCHVSPCPSWMTKSALVNSCQCAIID